MEQWIRAKYERRQYAARGPIPNPDDIPLPAELQVPGSQPPANRPTTAQPTILNNKQQPTKAPVQNLMNDDMFEAFQEAPILQGPPVMARPTSPVKNNIHNDIMSMFNNPTKQLTQQSPVVVNQVTSQNSYMNQFADFNAAPQISHAPISATYNTQHASVQPSQTQMSNMSFGTEVPMSTFNMTPLQPNQLNMTGSQQQPTMNNGSFQVHQAPPKPAPIIQQSTGIASFTSFNQNPIQPAMSAYGNFSQAPVAQNTLNQFGTPAPLMNTNAFGSFAQAQSPTQQAYGSFTQAPMQNQQQGYGNFNQAPQQQQQQQGYGGFQSTIAQGNDAFGGFMQAPQSSNGMHQGSTAGQMNGAPVKKAETSNDDWGAFQ